jgi:hypothetical protein
MIETVPGGCLCGQVRYEIDSVPDSSYLCHCRNCQKAHAAPYAALVIVPPENVRITTGNATRYERTSDSGNMTYRDFCGTCGTQLFSGSVVFPQIMSVKVMTFDEPNLVEPSQHVWVESAVDWVCMNDQLPRNDQQQSSEEFAKDLDQSR